MTPAHDDVARRLIARLNAAWGNAPLATPTPPPRMEHDRPRGIILTEPAMPPSREALEQAAKARPAFPRHQDAPTPSGPAGFVPEAFHRVLRVTRCDACGHADCEFYRRGRLDLCRACATKAGVRVTGIRGRRFRRQGGPA